MAKPAHKDLPIRAIAKSISWRILAIAVLGAISWIITRNWIEVGFITIIYNIVQILFYFLHERIWEKIRWGRKTHPLSEFNIHQELKEEDKKLIEEKLRQLGYID